MKKITKSKYFRILLFSAVLIFGCSFFANDPDTVPGGGEDPADGPVIDIIAGTPSARVENDADAIDLGDIVVGSADMTVSFLIHNNGDESLIIDSVALSDTANFSISSSHSFPEDVLPSSALPLEISFSPAAENTYPLQVTIVSNDEDNSSFILNYTVTVTPVPKAEIDVVAGASLASLSNDSDAYFIGTRTAGSSDITTSFQIQNDGDTDLVISSINLSDDTYYSLGSSFSFPETVIPSAFLPVLISFNPELEGTYPLQASILHNDAEDSPFLLNYSANVDPGLPELQIQINSLVYTHDSTAFQFGQLVSPETETVTVQMHNTGDAEILISGISLSDTDNYSLSGLPAFPFPIANGTYHEIDLTFEPEDTGTFDAVLQIANNSPISDYDVNLQGVCPDTIYTLNLEFDGTSGYFVYVCWLEDAAGTNFQNIWVSKRANPATDGLLGVGLPIWSNPDEPTSAINEYSDDIDAVAAVTVRPDLNHSIQLADPSVRQFRVMFEIDRSNNSNDYFGDRPSFLYQSELIDLDDLDSSYSLTLVGWMCNNTLSNNYSQAPLDLSEFPFFGTIDDVAFSYRTELQYIENSGGGTADMVNSLTITIDED